MILATCVATAAAVAFALDRDSVVEEKGVSADPKPLRPPALLDWRGTLFTPGDPAPGFDLAEVRTGERVSLDDFRGQPTVLLLSSFGCSVFCAELGRVIDLHNKYEGQVAFLFVAIRDAGHVIRDAGHPDRKKGPPVDFARPGESSSETRLRLVRQGVEFYDLPFPALLDADGEAERAYDAYPKRLVVVGPDGRIVHDGGRGAKGGPSDWDLAEVEAHLDSTMSQGRAAE